MCAALYCACSECMSEWVCERSKIVQLVFRWWIGLARSFICITVEIALACIFIWSLCMCVVVSCYCDANYYYSYIVDHIERRKRRWTETKRNTHIQQHIRNYHSRQGIWNKNGVIQSGAHCLFLFVGNKNKFEKKNELNKNGAFSEASKWSILCNNDDTCSIKYPLSMTVCEPRWMCRPCVCMCVRARARFCVCTPNLSADGRVLVRSDEVNSQTLTKHRFSKFLRVFSHKHFPFGKIWRDFFRFSRMPTKSIPAQF